MKQIIRVKTIGVKTPFRRVAVGAAVCTMVLASGCNTPKTAAVGVAGTAPITAPNSWTMYGANPSHNAVFETAHGSSRQVASNWSFAVPGAPSNASSVQVSAIAAWRDLLGFPIGVSVVKNTVYAPNDNGKLYALSASTGRPRWVFSAPNELMTTPLLSAFGGKRLVIVGVGNSNFSYSEAVRFAKTGAHIIRGTGFSAVDAIYAGTGKLAWTFQTKGEDMPTPLIAFGHLIFANGSGQVVALNPASGKEIWHSRIQSFVSMSSLDISGTTVVFGGTHPDLFYGINAINGVLVWAVKVPSVFSSSMGDGTAAVAGNTAVFQIETRVPKSGFAGSEEIAVDSISHKILWSRSLGVGKVPPRNKDASPIVVQGVVYTASPVTGYAYGIDLSDGSLIWKTKVSGRIKAPPALVNGRLLFPTAAGTVVSLDPLTGSVVHVWKGQHGGFGPQGLTVIGNTAFIGTNLGWMQAIPVSALSGRAG